MNSLSTKRYFNENNLEQLNSAGINPEIIEKVSVELDALEDPEKQWKVLTDKILNSEIPFAVHEALYHKIYKNTNTLKPAWFPDEKTVTHSNIHRCFKETQCHDETSFYQWSIIHKEEFYALTCKMLGITFNKKPAQYLSLTSNPTQPKWLEGSFMNIVESCFQANENNTAFKLKEGDTIKEVSYKELKENIAKISNGLIEKGYQKGDRIALNMPMTQTAIEIFLGIIAAGCVAVPIADSFSSDEIFVRLEISEAKLLLIQDSQHKKSKVIPMYQKVKEKTACPVYVVEKNMDTHLAKGDHSFEDLLSENKAISYVHIEAESESTVLFSSGTTGQPKAIPWSHVTPIKSASDAYYHHNIQAGDTLCWPTNLGWMMGPWLVYAAFINKACIALTDNAPTSSEFCEFVELSKTTMLGLVPSIVSVWRSQDMTKGCDWSSIKVFSSTGECSNASDMLYLMAQANYKPIIEYCGGTETGGGYISGTVLKPCIPGLFSSKAMGFDWTCINDDGTESGSGEVFFKPPTLGCSNYLLNRNHHEVYYEGVPQLPSGQILRRHGDRMESLTEGYYKACGRTDDSMNLGGIKVSAVQIEELCQSISNIKEVAAIAAPMKGGGPSLLVIFCVLSSKGNAMDLKQEMQSLIKTKLNPLFKIHDVRIVDILPRTASNKIIRKKCLEIYCENHD